MRSPTIGATLELDVEVAYTVSGRDVPARVGGSNDTAAPAEYAEIEIEAVYVTRKMRDGATARVDILPVLDEAQEQALIGSIGEAVVERAIDDWADAKERRYEAWRER